MRLRTPEIKPALASNDGVNRFLARTRMQSPYLSVTAEADAEIADRAAMIGADDGRAIVDEASFWTEVS